MKFTSTRNRNLIVEFSQAVRQCVPSDGGVYVPTEIEDLRRWIYYIDENTSFASIAGTLTSAFIKNEFSPVLSEKIVQNAFPFEPKIQQLDDKLFMMELFHGYTGSYRDFGVSYLCSFLETTYELKGGNTIFFNFSHGGLASLLAKVLRGKKHLKAVIVYQKGSVQGLKEEDFFWNGGNIYPVEVDASESEIADMIAEIYSDEKFVKNYNLTLSNTTNICRILAQMFFFPYSFAKIKHKIDGDIYYAMDTGNFGTLMAGLYSWRSALPVTGFFVPSSPSLAKNPLGKPVIPDSMIDFSKRNKVNPTRPANIERLESFFDLNQAMMGNFVFPEDINEKQTEIAAQTLYKKYGIFAGLDTARSYAIVCERGQSVFNEEGAIVLCSMKHPFLSSDFCRHVLGEAPKMPQNIFDSLKQNNLNRPKAKTKEDLIKIIESIV